MCVCVYVCMCVWCYSAVKKEWNNVICSSGPREGCGPWGLQDLDTTEWLHFHFSLSCLEKEMATHPSVLAWRIPGTGEPGGLPSMGSHRVGHDWSDLAAAAEIIIQSAVCQRQISYDTVFMCSLKKRYRWTYFQNRNRLTDMENKFMVTKGERGPEGQVKRLGLIYANYYM